MTATLPTTRPSRWAPADRRSRVEVVVLSVVGLVAAVLGTRSTEVARGLTGALVLVGLTVIAFQSRTTALRLAFAGLALLGFGRRALIPFAGWSQNDPVLLVSPAIAVVLLVVARDRAPAPRTFLSSLAVFQLLWVVCSVANPNEQSLVTAAQALVFFVVPLLWFFVGRTLEPRHHDDLLRLLLFLAVPVLVLGYWHTFAGLLSFELTWLGVADVPPSLIFVRGFHIRPFSTLTSPQEYGIALSMIGLVVWARVLHRDGNRRLLLALLGANLVALFLQGSRGVLLSFLAAFLVTTAVRFRASSGPLIGVGLLFVAVYLLGQGLDFTVAPQTAEEQEQASTVSALVRHQIEGLLNPTSSTAALHLDLYFKGFEEGFENPFGLGPSRYQFSARSDQRADDEQTSPESQLSITAAAFGLAPTISLAALYVTAYLYAYRLYRWRPSSRHLAWLAILVVVGDQALNGRLYFTSTLVGLVLGGLAMEYGLLRDGRLRADG